MPEDRDERAGYGEEDQFDEFDEFGDPDEFDGSDDLDDFDDFDDEDDFDPPGGAWPAPGYPPGDPGHPPGGSRYGGGSGPRRGWALALTAVVAAAFGFGVVLVAMHEATASPAAASAAPSSRAPSSGTQFAPQGGGLPSLPSGATERLEIGGQVTAVSATSITLNGGGQAITAAVTRATTITGKVTSILLIKVGDVVSASITGTNGKLTAVSIQDPASLPSGSGQ
jgi:hypothetical protein